MSGDKGVAVWASPAALLHSTILLLRHLQQPFIHPFSPKRSCCVSFGMPGGLLASSHPAVSTVWTCLWWGHRGLCTSSWGTRGVGLPQQQGLGEHRGLRSLLPHGCHQNTRVGGKSPQKSPRSGGRLQDPAGWASGTRSPCGGCAGCLLIAAGSRGASKQPLNCPNKH